MIFYLLPRRDWESDGQEHVAFPAEDGFVHCCDEQQIADVRLRYFPVDEEVIALGFDPTRLPVETRYEPGTGGESQRFPHVYGALQRAFVARVRDA